MTEALGQTIPQFSAVRTVFEDHLESGDDLGAACAVSVAGELVVDLAGGFQDRKKTLPWEENTIVGIYSSGKAVLALLVAHAVDAGLLSYDQRVAHYWPEFAAEEKGAITLAQVMSHQGGLCGIPDEMAPSSWLDWDLICTKLAEMMPLWAPGSANGYHPQTYGFIVGEVLRRSTGKTVGELLRELLAHDDDMQVYCGLTPAEFSRSSGMTKPSRAPNLGEITDYRQTAFLTKWAAPSGVSREDWAKAEIPASNIHADARSLARMMSIIACGGMFERKPVLSEGVLGKMCTEQCRGDDLVLPFNISWACGVMRNTNLVYGPVDGAVGHSGFGGSCVFADPVNGISFAFVLNKMSHHLMGDPRSLRLIEAVYKAL